VETRAKGEDKGLIGQRYTLYTHVCAQEGKRESHTDTKIPPCLP